MNKKFFSALGVLFFLVSTSVSNAAEYCESYTDEDHSTCEVKYKVSAKGGFGRVSIKNAVSNFNSMNPYLECEQKAKDIAEEDAQKDFLDPRSVVVLDFSISSCGKNMMTDNNTYAHAKVCEDLGGAIMQCGPTCGVAGRLIEGTKEAECFHNCLSSKGCEW